MVDPVAKLALLAGDVILAVGVALPTVTFTTDEVVAEPWLSVAFAVNAYDPAGTLVHAKEYGDVRSSPSFVVPLKNSTFVTDPLSDALAVIVIVDPETNVALLAGAVMLTVGGG